MLVAQVVIVGAVVSRTMNAAVQVLVLPLRSATRSVTVLVPRPTRVPMVGTWLMLMALQLSVATTALVKFATAAWQLALADAEMLVAHWVIVGAVVSRTMNLAVQVLVLPLASATRMVTVLVPRPTRVPMVGIWLMLTALQLSVATTAFVKFATAAWQ